MTRREASKLADRIERETPGVASLMEIDGDGYAVSVRYPDGPKTYYSVGQYEDHREAARD